MKKLILFVVFGIVVISGSAQNTPPPMPANDGLIGTNTRYGTIHGKGEISYEEAIAEYETIDGSPYLHGGEISVDLIYHNDSIIKDINIQYDTYNHEIIAKSKNGETVILDQLYYKGFVYNNEGRLETYLKVNSKKFKYSRVLFQNEDFIFCQDIKTTISDDTRYIPGLETKHKKFIHSKTYQIIQGDLVKTSKLRKDALIKYLPWEYRKEVPDLKKKLKLKKLNKEEDYLVLFNEF